MAHSAVNTLGHLLALHVTPATAGDRAEVGRLAEAVQAVTGESIKVAFVDQGYTGHKPAQAASEHGIRLEVVKLAHAKRGLVLLPWRWIVERSFAWPMRCRRLVKDYERLHPCRLPCRRLRAVFAPIESAGVSKVGPI